MPTGSGLTGSHKIEGIGIGFIPPLWQADEVDEILTVSTEEAKAMTRRLAREEGLFAGTVGRQCRLLCASNHTKPVCKISHVFR